MAFPRTLHGRTWNETTPLLALVDDNARALLTPNRDALADALATPQRRSAMRRTLDEIAALPPEVAVPVLVALEHWRRGSDTTQHVTEALAHALRAHGDLVMAVVDALKFDLAREAPLPLPRHPDLADALRAAMRADSVIGRTLAHALHDKAWDAAGAALRDAPPPHAHAIWRALSDDDRTALLSAAETRVRSLAAGEHGDNLCIAWRRIAGAAPLVALKMTALASDDPDARACGVDALADAPQIVRSIVALLRPDIQNFLRAHPVLAAALADLDDDPPSARPTRGMPGAIRRRT